MAIDVQDLIITPAPMKSNKQTNGSFKFSGFVDTNDDNPVTVTLSVPDSEPNVSFVNDNGQKVKSISLDPFNFKVGSSDTYTKTVKVNIAKTNGQPDLTDVDLSAVTAKSDESDTSSSLSYK